MVSCLRFRTPGIAVIIGCALILILLAAVLTGAVLPTPVTGVIGLPGSPGMATLLLP
jgi:hypothetical protein